MPDTTKSDEVRAFVFDNYIVQARGQKSASVAIVAGDASVITSKAANGYQFKTGQRK
jgi:hypothetical protein